MRREQWAWALYDWGNSAFAVTVMAGFFPAFYKSVYAGELSAADSTATLGFANALASLIIALAAPILGTLADMGGYKKRLLATFAFIGIVMSAALALVAQGAWELALLCFILATVGFAGGNLFYDALLPSVASVQKRLGLRCRLRTGISGGWIAVCPEPGDVPGARVVWYRRA